MNLLVIDLEHLPAEALHKLRELLESAIEHHHNAKNDAAYATLNTSLDQVEGHIAQKEQTK